LEIHFPAGLGVVPMPSVRSVQCSVAEVMVSDGLGVRATSPAAATVDAFVSGVSVATAVAVASAVTRQPPPSTAIPAEADRLVQRVLGFGQR
jgi:hypothetical protein